MLRFLLFLLSMLPVLAQARTVMNDLHAHSASDTVPPNPHQMTTHKNSDIGFVFTPTLQTQQDIGWAIGDRAGKENSDYRMRRQRIGANGRITHDVGYRISVETGARDAELRDGYLSYRGAPNFYAALGHTREAHGIYEKGGNQWIHFMERPTGITAFQPRRSYGLLLSPYDEHWTVQAGLHGGTTGQTGQNNTGWGATGRAVWRPWVNQPASQVLHFGVNTRYREPRDPNLEFSATGQEATLRDPLVDTGWLSGVEHYRTVAGEFYFTDGPLALLSEARMASVERAENLSDPIFWGATAQITYFLTGEQREYQLIGSTFGKMTPATSVIDGGPGAWEIGLRLDAADMADEDIEGGQLYSATLGLSWWPLSFTRLMINYVVTETQDSPSGDVDPQYFMTRVQLAF